ncbi:MAG: ABC transporter permease [Gammaproteobacteria bacterium]
MLAANVRKNTILDFFVQPLMMIYSHYALLIKVVKRDLRSRYIGSFLGLYWSTISPIAMLTAYAVVYIFIFHAKAYGFTSLQYVLFIFSGLVPYLGFADAVSTSLTSIVSNSSLVKNTLFPIELIPVKSVFVSQAGQAAGFFILFLALLATKQLSWYILYLPLIWLIQLIFTIGLMWILSSLNVFFRDLQYAINIILMIMMMLSPISYSISMVPHALKILIMLNPFSYLIVAYQDILVFHKVPDVTIILALLVMSSSLFFIGYYIINRTKVLFAEYV